MSLHDVLASPSWSVNNRDLMTLSCKYMKLSALWVYRYRTKTLWRAIWVIFYTTTLFCAWRYMVAWPDQKGHRHPYNHRSGSVGGEAMHRDVAAIMNSCRYGDVPFPFTFYKPQIALFSPTLTVRPSTFLGRPFWLLQMYKWYRRPVWTWTWGTLAKILSIYMISFAEQKINQVPINFPTNA